MDYHVSTKQPEKRAQVRFLLLGFHRIYNVVIIILLPDIYYYTGKATR